MPQVDLPQSDGFPAFKAAPDAILSPGAFNTAPAPATSAADLLSAANEQQAEQPTAASSVVPEPAPPKRATKRRKS